MKQESSNTFKIIGNVERGHEKMITPIINTI